ncbi:class III signal peptide-containing protein [Methanotorris formicicus]|uniref:Class III signal peptide-containing protein n=1 Tax=Methanotorris formicicus Mc-S-70 TaxID=647171 RepID=H1KY82_9EURY|nr:class III signal peptide-containing protein [Methanotorris formicicus]EHP87442.1 protein of unknown function DUF361 [Methanotorris formicicus Mc-S-70]
MKIITSKRAQISLELGILLMVAVTVVVIVAYYYLTTIKTSGETVNKTITNASTTYSEKIKDIANQLSNLSNK